MNLDVDLDMLGGGIISFQWGIEMMDCSYHDHEGPLLFKFQALGRCDRDQQMKDKTTNLCHGCNNKQYIARMVDCCDEKSKYVATQ